MQTLNFLNLRKLWLSLLLLVGATAIAVPGIQEVMDGNVAKVGDTEYATIEEAVANWGPGKTLTLLADVTTTSTVIVEVNATKSTQNWTLNLGDYNWTANGCNAFQLYAAGGTVMNQNYGLKIYANESGGITASGKYCIECKYDTSTAGYRPRLEIHGGTYNGSYIVYYQSLTYNNTNVSNGPSTFFQKSNDGSEPVFNGNFALAKCPITIQAGYFNGTSFNTYPVGSTADTNLQGGHFKTMNAFPSASNNKGIKYGSYRILVKSDASIDVTNGAPATYEASTTQYTSILTGNRQYNGNSSSYYPGLIYFESANYAIEKYNIPITLNNNIVATQDKTISTSATLTIDATAEGSTYTGNITLSSNNAKFVIKFPEGGGHYGVSVNSGTLHVEESVADGIVTRTYSRIATISDPEAKVGDTGYNTVYDAFYAIDGSTDNKTIVLQKDVTNAGIVTNGTATGGDGKTVATFDLNGKSIGIGSAAAGNNADYTLTIIDRSEEKTGTVTNSDASLFILALTGISDYSGSYTLKVQAGTWQFDPSAVNINGETRNLVDEGYVARDNGNGTWTVVETTRVAQIGETKYVSLQAAADAAHEMTGDVTITLLEDISEYAVIHQKAGLNLTIDGDGKTVAGQIFIDGNGRASGTETLTIKNIQFEGNTTNFYSGTDAFILVPSTKDTGKPWTTGAYNYAHNVTVTDCSFTSTSTSSAYDVVCYKSTSAAGEYNVTINNCTASGTMMHSLAQLTGTTGGTITNCTVTGSESFVNVSGGTGDFTISGNTFTSDENASAGYGIRENGSSTAVITLTDNNFTAANAVKLGKGGSATNGTINVVSGTYVGDIVKDIAASATGKIVISGGHFSAPLGNEAYAEFIAEDYLGMNNIYPSDEAAPNGVVSPDMAVMYTRTNGSVTFYTAIPSAFSTDGTYKLLKDVTRTTRMTPGSLASNVTLDLNGHTLTSTATDCGILLGRAGSGTSPKTFSLVDTSEEGGGKLVCTNLDASSNSSAAIQVTGKYNFVTIGENVTIEGGCVAMLSENQTLTVNGTINGGNDFAVATNGSSTKNTTITINEGAVLTSDVTALYLPGNEGVSATINGGTITGGDTGIEVRAGNLVVNGGTITTTATEYNYTPNGSGTTTKGAAIAVVQHNTKLPIDAQILGGTLTGLNQIAVVDAQDNDLEGVSVKAKDDLIATTTIPEDFKWVSNGDGTSSLGLKAYVAQIGEGEDAVKYESLAEAVAAVPANGTETTITMIDNEMIDVVGSAITIPTNKNVVIDLNGFQVVGTAAGGSTSALITNKGTLTIKDSSDTNKDGTGTGQLISGATTTWIYEGDGNYAGSYASNTITNGGTLTIESGYIENLSTGSATYAVDNNSSGGNAILNMNGGLLKARSVAVREFANSTTLKNEINMTGGIIQAGNSGIWIQLPGSDASKAMQAALNVTGGTITGGSYAFYDYSYGNAFTATQYQLDGGTFNGYVFSYGANINITDGTYNSDIAIKQTQPSVVAVSGGKFGGDVYTYGANASEGFITGGIFASTTYVDEGETYDCDWLYCLADGYVVSDNTDPETKDAYPYGVRQANYICAIGTTKYETLADAVAAAGTAETTITLLAEAATEGIISGDGVVVPSGSNITFDLNGLTYVVTGTTVGSSNTQTQGFQLLKESNITFKNGTLKATSPTAQMVIQNYSNLTLEDVTLDGTTLSGVAYALSNNSGTVNLTGSTSITAKEGGRAFDTCKFGSYAIPTVNINTTGTITGPIEATGGKLNVENGQFNVTWVTDNNYTAGDIQITGGIFTAEPAEEYCAEGYIVTDNEDDETKATYPYAVMSKEDAGIFELVDGEIYPYLDYTEDKEAASVTYKRNFKNKDWQALFIPFDINDVTELTDRYEFAKIHMVALENDGTYTTGNKIEIYYTRVTSGKISANQPYLIKAKNTGWQDIVVENTILKDTHNMTPRRTSTMAADYIFTGTYEGFVGTKPYEFMAMGGGTINWGGKGTPLGTYRWYIKVEPYDDDYAKPSIIFVEADEDATNISAVDSNEETEIEGYYSVNGVRSDVPVKGMNIVKYKNGKTKKIMIK